jgi:hypothetical protein
MLGMNPDELSGSLYNSQRVRAANAFRDYLSGNVPAGTAGRKLIDDPRFQGLDPQKQASIYQQAYGHGLEEDLQADQLAKSYGSPLTYSDISGLQMRQKNQAKDLAYLGAMSSMMGTKGQMFSIANNPYDPVEGGVKFEGEYGPQIAHITPEQHAFIRAKFQQQFSPLIPRNSVVQQGAADLTQANATSSTNRPAVDDATRQKLRELEMLRRKKAEEEHAAEIARNAAATRGPIYPTNPQAFDWGTVN